MVSSTMRKVCIISTGLKISFNPGIKSVLKTLRERGYLLILVTNQGGIAKGLYTREDAAHVHHLMAEELGVTALI